MMNEDELNKLVKNGEDALAKALQAAARAKTPEEIKAAMELTAAAMKDIKGSMDVITKEIFDVLG